MISETTNKALALYCMTSPFWVALILLSSTNLIGTFLGRTHAFIRIGKSGAAPVWFYPSFLSCQTSPSSTAELKWKIPCCRRAFPYNPPFRPFSISLSVIRTQIGRNFAVTALLVTWPLQQGQFVMPFILSSKCNWMKKFMFRDVSNCYASGPLPFHSLLAFKPLNITIYQ